MVDVELHDEVVDWMESLDDEEWDRTVLLTTFRKQRNNERAEIARARKVAAACAEQNP